VDKKKISQINLPAIRDVRTTAKLEPADEAVDHFQYVSNHCVVESRVGADEESFVHDSIRAGKIADHAKALGPVLSQLH
jgi:hypothetical protein